jgi:hypothetical protein
MVDSVQFAMSTVLSSWDWIERDRGRNDGAAVGHHNKRTIASSSTEIFNLL